MKRLSREEIALLKESFMSSAKICRDFRYKELTFEQAKQYIEAFYGRYKTVPCVDTLVEMLERDFYHNLSMGCYSLRDGVKNKPVRYSEVSFQKTYEKVKEVKNYGSWEEFFNHSMENELMVNCGYLSFFIRMMNMVLKLHEQEHLADNDAFWDYVIKETNSCGADCKYAAGTQMVHYVVIFIGYLEKEEQKERAANGEEFYQKLLQKEA